MNLLTRLNPLSKLSRWNPLRDFEDIEKRFSSWLQPDSKTDGNGHELLTVAEWSPSVDITEDDKEYAVKAELPEVKKEDVKVNVENGVLTITGERKFEKEEKNKKYHRVERSYGTFARSFTLPNDGDAAKVNAEFKDGMLRIRVAKSEAARPRQIEVKA